jgi:hypothetical protein
MVRSSNSNLDQSIVVPKASFCTFQVGCGGTWRLKDAPKVCEYRLEKALDHEITEATHSAAAVVGNGDM